MRLTIAAALALFALVGCSASRGDANDRALTDECEMMAPALDEIIGRAPEPASAECYARAGKLWKAEHELVVLEVAYATEDREPVRLAKPLAELRLQIAAARDDIAAQKQLPGCPMLAAKDGAAETLRGYVAADLAKAGRRLAAGCKTRSVKPGEVKNFVYTAESIMSDASAGAHDVVLSRTARNLAKGVQR